MTATTSTSASTRKARTYKSPNGEIGRRLTAAARLQQQINDLQTQLDGHREHLLHHMNSQNLDTLAFGDVVLTRHVRHNWTYTVATERELLQLKQTQKWEQQHGAATDTPTVYVKLSSITKEAQE